MDTPTEYRNKNKEQGRRFFGLLAVAAGAIILLHNLFPHFTLGFHLSWPLILLVVGLVVGFNKRFRGNAWWIMVLIGGVYLFQPYFFPGIPTRTIIWPGLLILVGLVMIFRKRDPSSSSSSCKASNLRLISNDADTINIDVTFGGRKEIITLKNFKGGFIRATFGGAEVNLGAAEGGPEPMIVEVQATFSGVEIIVPAHWEVQNEINPTMGSVEDQRMIRTTDASAEKRVLILRGSCSFASVEIKSY